MGDLITIREMAPADCHAVAEIRVRGWQTAYQGLIPQSFLDALDVEADTERRLARLTESDASVVNLVAEQDGRIVGWACHGLHRDDDVRTEDVELYAIYVHPDQISTGVGRALIRESTARCTAAGYERMFLWVLKGNARARRFYARAGFRADGAEEPFEVDRVGVPEVRYVRVLTGS